MTDQQNMQLFQHAVTTDRLDKIFPDDRLASAKRGYSAQLNMRENLQKLAFWLGLVGFVLAAVSVPIWGPVWLVNKIIESKKEGATTSTKPEGWRWGCIIPIAVIVIVIVLFISTFESELCSMFC